MNRTKKSSERIQRPAICNPKQLAAFQHLVVEGGQASASGLGARISRARLLGFHYEYGELVSIAALKQPGERYRERVFRKAETILRPDLFTIEFGWVVTRDGFRRRGLGRRLSERLVKRTGTKNLFATTRTDNRSMQAILESLGFEPAGKPFSGAGDGYLLRLWVRLVEAPAMPASE